LEDEEEDENGVLSVPHQVEVLLEMATDPNLIGRMYHGLQLWV